MACWGFNAFGQSTSPVGRFKSVSAGGYQTCGVDESASVVCWGGIRDGEADAPSGSFQSVSAGEGHTCGVTTEGALSCWGLNDNAQASPPTGEMASVSAGWTHSCAVGLEGELQCWGDERDGQTSPPTGFFSAVSASRNYACALGEDSAVSCWGLDHYEQASPPAGEFAQVSAGGEYACAVDKTEEIQCWGRELEREESEVPQAGFSVSGVAWNYGQFDWAEVGLCIEVTDPAPILYGSDPLVLSSSTIAPGGAFRVNNVETVAELGLFLTVDDCNPESNSVRTATGVSNSEYKDLGEGDTLGHQLVLVMDDATVADFDKSLRKVGYTGDPLAETGAIMGFVRDDQGGYLSGATLNCRGVSAGCPTVYYLDADPTDGLFGEGENPNGSTEAGVEAVFLIPNAPFAIYVASHAEFGFKEELFGHVPGVVSVLQFVGRKE